MYTVIERFRDLRDGGHIYHPGDTFPRSGLSVDQARLDELSGTGNRVGRPLIRGQPEKKGRRKRGD